MRGILALCAVGLIRGDQVLAESAINEISRFTPEQFGIDEEKSWYLKAVYSVVKGDLLGAKRLLSKSVRVNPTASRRWATLSRFMRK